VTTIVATETALLLARKAGQHMADRNIENARLEAELLLAHTLGISRLDIYLQHDRPLNEGELERFRGLVRRRLRHEPLQYILGRTSFRQLELQVDRRALIPRPETEVLVGEVLAWAQARPQSELRALDLGTGTGAIALSLAREGALQVVATDISADALDLARSNAERHNLHGNVEVRLGSLWQPIGSDEQFDIIASNPPYVGESERASLAPEVRDWEPAVALFSDADGLGVIRQIVACAPAHLRAGGLLALEIGTSQSAQALELVGSSERFAEAHVLRDLAGRERVLLAETRG
jgi:release factor glutamine methyltransferase